jgi:hypothetical protein
MDEMSVGGRCGINCSWAKKFEKPPGSVTRTLMIFLIE